HPRRASAPPTCSGCCIGRRPPSFDRTAVHDRRRPYRLLALPALPHHLRVSRVRPFVSRHMHSLRRAFRSSRIRLRKHGSHSTAPLIYLAAIVVALLVAFFPRRAEPAAEEANYSTLLAALDSGKVRRLEIVPGNRIVAELADTAAMPLEIEFPMGASDGLLKRAEEAGAEIVLKRPSDVSGYADLVLTILL